MGDHCCIDRADGMADHCFIDEAEIGFDRLVLKASRADITATGMNKGGVATIGLNK